MTTFTQDEIIEMAKEAGLSNPLWIENDYEIIETFAHLVAAKEREAFEKICDEVINSERDGTEEADHNNNESYEGYDDGWFNACNTLKFFVKKRGKA